MSPPAGPTGTPGVPAWSAVFPLAGMVAVAIALAKAGTVGAVVSGVVLIGSVLAAVHHAEVVAHRVGEPFGTLVLAVAVTVIEVSLIVSLVGSPGTELEFAL